MHNHHKSPGPGQKTRERTEMNPFHEIILGSFQIKKKFFVSLIDSISRVLDLEKKSEMSCQLFYFLNFYFIIFIKVEIVGEEKDRNGTKESQRNC